MDQKLTDQMQMDYSKGNIVSIFGFGPEDAHYEDTELAKEYIGYQAHILHLQPGQSDGFYAGSFEMLNGPAKGEIVMFADASLSPWMTEPVAEALGLHDALPVPGVVPGECFDALEPAPDVPNQLGEAETVLYAIRDRIRAKDITECIGDVDWMIEHYLKHYTFAPRFTSDPGCLTEAERQERVNYLSRYSDPEPDTEPVPEPMVAPPAPVFGEGDEAIITGFHEADSYGRPDKDQQCRERIGARVHITNTPHRNGPDPDAYSCQVLYLSGPLTGETDIFYQVYLNPAPQPVVLLTHGDEAVIHRIGLQDSHAHPIEHRQALEGARVRLDGAAPSPYHPNAYHGFVRILSGPERGERRYFHEVYLRPAPQAEDLLYDHL